MKRYFSYFILLIVFLTLCIGTLSAEHSVRLSGHVPEKIINHAVLLERVDATTHVPITFVLPLRSQEALEKLVQRIHDPTDKEYYGKHLTSEKFIELFSPTEEDYDKVAAYAKSLGLTVTCNHPNRTLLNVSGEAAFIETAFNLHLHHYQKPDGQKFYAPDNNPEVPSSIASIIHSIVGLDNQAVHRSFSRQKEISAELLDSNATYPSGGFSPNDIITAYNLSGISANGSGQIIALFELATYLESDITAYTNYFGLPSPKLKNILIDGGSMKGINPEVAIDIELAIALAPESQIYVYEGPDTDQGSLNIYNRIATDNLASQVSTSWGIGEDRVSPQVLQAGNAIFLQMAAQGQTIYAAAGDHGAYGDYPSTALVVWNPASQPYVVGVGGTTLRVNAQTGAYVSEQVWNNGVIVENAKGGVILGAGGGGVSTFWPIPSWQKNVPTVYSTTNRNVPDVALNADQITGYSIYYNGAWTTYGGTSCAAPLWAAFTARVNQQRLVNKLPPLGFANPIYYAIGRGSLYSQDFHDITVGNNFFYYAKVGYDNASGWGSFNGAYLFGTLTATSAQQLLRATRLWTRVKPQLGL